MIILMALLFCPQVDLESQSVSEVDWLEIENDIQSADYSSAISKLESMYVGHQDSLRLLQKMSQCYYHLGDYYKVKETDLKILEKDPENRIVLTRLGSVYDSELNLPKAIKYYSALLKIDTSNAYYYKQNALMQLKAGEKQTAFQFLAKSYKLNPKDVITISEMCDLMLESDNFEQVDSILTIALQRDSSNIKLLLTKARSKYKQKDYQAVVKTMERTLGRIDLPDYYIKMLGFAYLQIDSVDQAIYRLERLIHSQEKEFIHYYLAIAYDKKEDQEASIFHYEQAIDKAISDNISLYHAEVAKLYESSGDKKRAIEYFRKAYDFEPVPKYLYFSALLADTYYRDKSIAIRYFDQYIRTNDTNVAYMDYARKKSKYLKELVHQSKTTRN